MFFLGLKVLEDLVLNKKLMMEILILCVWLKLIPLKTIINSALTPKICYRLDYVLDSSSKFFFISSNSFCQF